MRKAAECACRYAGDDAAVAACIKSYESERDAIMSRRRDAALRLVSDYAEHVLNNHELDISQASAFVEAALTISPDDLDRLAKSLSQISDEHGRIDALLAAAQDPEVNPDTVAARPDEIAVAAILFLGVGERHFAARLMDLLPPPAPLWAPLGEPEPEADDDPEAVPVGSAGGLPKQIPHPQNPAGKGSLPPRPAKVAKAFDPITGVRRGATTKRVASVADLLRAARRRAQQAAAAAVQKAYERDEAEREEQLAELIERTNRILGDD
jgi:hypothetical protein